jgi:hypothetical protein
MSVVSAAIAEWGGSAIQPGAESGIMTAWFWHPPPLSACTIRRDRNASDPVEIIETSLSGKFDVIQPLNFEIRPLPVRLAKTCARM